MCTTGKKLLLLKLVVTSDTGQRYDRVPHCCAYDGQHVIDNFMPIIIVENSDRKEPKNAISVFRNLYPGYKSVQIHKVYELLKR